MTQQWALSVQIPSSPRGTRRPSHRPALGEALIVLCGRQHPGEGWKVKWPSCRGSQSPFPGRLIPARSMVSATCLYDLVIHPVSRAKERPKFLMKHLIVVW